MANKIELLSMTDAELEAFVTEELGESRFRAKQIAQWLNRGVEIAGMTNLSAALREKLEARCVANPVRIREVYRSKLD